MTEAKDPRSRRAGLTRAIVAEGALRVIDREGLAGLTMRALATELGVHAMSPYNHVEDKDDLLDAVAELLGASVGPPPPSLSWDDTLRAIASALRAVVLTHPHAAPLVASRPIASPAALVPVDAALAALRRGGLGPEEAVTTFWLFGSYVVGALIGEAASLIERRPVSIGPDKVEAAAEAGALPALAELAPWIAASTWEREFDRGLERLIAGVRARSS
ncbi:MAG: TetR/AcrR family transcriptional regulator [Solirubrobacteraceae bacterium]|nr:TetR/AcrR family transcriptional regulator [Solirubrobacteraceae bacterium]